MAGWTDPNADAAPSAPVAPGDEPYVAPVGGGGGWHDPNATGAGGGWNDPNAPGGAKAAHKGGGGFMSLLKGGVENAIPAGLGGVINPLNLVKGITHIAGEVGQNTGLTPSNLVESVKQLDPFYRSSDATRQKNSAPIGNAVFGNQTDVAAKDGKPGIAKGEKGLHVFAEQSPTLYQVGRGVEHTVQGVPDIAVNAAEDATGNGPGLANSIYGRDIHEQGVVPWALQQAGNVAMLASGGASAGAALGFGNAAEAAGLEGLAARAVENVGDKGIGAVDTAAKAQAAAEASRAAGNASAAAEYESAATNLAKAERLRAAVAARGGAAQAAERGVAGAKTVAHFGNQVAGAPAELYTKLIPKLADSIPGVDTAAAAAKVGETLGKIPGVQEAKERLAARSTAKELFAKQAGEEQRLANPVNSASAQIERLLPEHDEQVAAYLARSGDAATVLPHLATLPDAEIQAVIDRNPFLAQEGVTPAAVRKAADFTVSQAQSVWRNAGQDVPVTVEHSLGVGPDGREYMKVAGSNTGIPADEISGGTFKGTKNLTADAAARMAQAHQLMEDSVYGPKEGRHVAGYGDKEPMNPVKQAGREANVAGQPAPIAVGKLEDQLRAPVQKLMDYHQGKLDEALQGGLSERPAPLSTAAEKQAAADEATAKSLRRQVAKEEARQAQVAKAAERAKAQVEGRGNARIGTIAGKAREQMAEADQLATGLKGRQAQTAAAAARAEGLAAQGEKYKVAEEPKTLKAAVKQAEATGHDYVTGYHTTTPEALDEIRRNGIHTGATDAADPHSGRGVYGWKGKVSAGHYGGGGKPFVEYRVPLDSLSESDAYLVSGNIPAEDVVAIHHPDGTVERLPGADGPVSRATYDSYDPRHNPADTNAARNARLAAKAEAAARPKLPPLPDDVPVLQQTTTRGVDAAAARAAADEIKGVRAPKTTGEVQRQTNQAAAVANARTAGETGVTERLTGAEAGRQESALQRAQRQLASHEETAGARADRVQNKANAQEANAANREIAARSERVLALQKRMAEIPEQAANHPSVQAPQVRSLLSHASAVAESLRARAGELEATDPGLAAQLRAAADAQPKTPAEVADQAKYIAGGEVPEGGVRQAGSAGARIRSRVLTGSERARETDVAPLTVEGQRQQVLSDIAGRPRNDLPRMFQHELGSTAAKVATEHGLEGSELAAHLAELKAPGGGGYTAWDPEGTGGKLPTHRVTADSPVIPTRILDNYQKWTQTKDPTWLSKAANAVNETRLIKLLGTGFVQHKALADMVLNQGVADVGPIASIKGALAAHQQIKEGVLPADVGIMHGRPIEPGEGLAGKAKNIVPQIKSKGMAAFRSLDTHNRVGLYNTLTERGLSPQTASEVVKLAAGDLQGMNPATKAAARAVFTYAPWQLHLAQVAKNLVAAHPAGLAEASAVAQADARAHPGQQVQPGELADFANPFGSFIGTPTPKAGQSMGDAILQRTQQSINPLLELGAGALTGLNLRKGQQVTTPGHPFGAQGATGPLLGQPGNLAGFGLHTLVPQVGQIQDVLHGAKGSAGYIPYRQDTGQPENKGGGRGRSGGVQAQPDTTKLDAIARLLGFPHAEKAPPKKAAKRGR